MGNRSNRLTRLLIILAALAPLAPEAGATVLTPEFQVLAERSLADALPGEPAPLLLLVRQDVQAGELRLTGAGGLTLERSDRGVDIPVPAGYRAVPYTLRGDLGPHDELEFEIRIDGVPERQRSSLGRRTRVLDPGQLVEIEPPRVDPSGFSRPRPLPSPEGTYAAVPKTAMLAPRSVQATGRINFQDPRGNVRGADGVTVKVMKPVPLLDDETLGEGVTDVNGDFDFTFLMDGTQDIYVKVEPANDTAVNVGTGLFFHTYQQRIDYPAFGGTLIDLGSRTFTGDINIAFWITTAITRAHRILDGAGYTLDRVHVRFPDDSKSTSWYWPLGGLEGIHLTRYSGWRTSTIYHEYGHHFVYQKASAVSPYYCNGLCEPDVGCGHCYWCEENEAVAWSEGFPHWLSYILKRVHVDTFGYDLYDFSVRDAEYNQVCFEKGTLERGLSTEGIFTSFLIDLVDENDENDTAFDSLATDQSRLSAFDILNVATGPKPNTSYGFIEEMTRYLATEPGFTLLDRYRLWQTVRNNGLAEDTVPPTAPTLVTSTTHPVGVSSTSNMPTLAFTGGTDDYSGVVSYYVTMTPSAQEPDGSGVDTGGEVMTWPTPLAPGNWYANVRSVDGAGNPSPDWISYGPMVVGPAAPVDLVPVPGPFWEGPVVVDNSPSATPSAAGFPAELLPGDTYVSLFYENDSPSGAPGDTLTSLIGIPGASGYLPASVHATIGAGETFPVLNIGPVQVQGGRSRIFGFVDLREKIPEVVEENNRVGVSVVARPDSLPIDQSTGFPPPPKALLWPSLLPTAPPSVAGHRVTPSNTFAAVVLDVDPGSFSSSYSLSVFTPSTGTFSGFENPLAEMSVSYDRAVIGFTGFGPGGAADIGVASDYNVHTYTLLARNSVLRPLDVSTDLVWAEGDIVRLLEFDFGPGDLGYVYITIEPDWDRLSTRLAAAWMSEADSARALSQGAEAYLFGNRAKTLPFQITTPGTYCLALTQLFSGSNSVSPGTVRVTTYTTPLPEVSIPEEDPFWPGGFVITPQPDQSQNLEFPAELVGDASATFVNFALINSGPVDAPSVPVSLSFQGEPLLDWNPGLIPAGGRVEVRHANPINIPGGRRTLSLTVDPDAAVAEFVESNNVYSLQMGWTGPVLAPGQPVNRPAPPDPFLGLGTVPFLTVPTTGPDAEDGDTDPLTFRTVNCDGVRLDPAQSPGSRWHGVAVIPALGEDVDLTLFRGGVPAAEAYVDALTTSSSGQSGLEFVLVNTAASGAGSLFDVGVRNVDAKEAYTLNAAGGIELAAPNPVASYGPFYLEADALRLYELDLQPGTYDITIDNQSGQALLGASVHAPLSPSGSPWHSRNDLTEEIPYGLATTPGGDLAFTVVIPEGSDIEPVGLPVNKLANPGFEAGPTGSGVADWLTFGNAYTEAAGGVFVPCEGNQLVSMFGPFTGSFGVSGVFQEFPAAPGEEWSFSVKSRHASADPMTGTGNATCPACADNWVVQRLEFFDAADSLIGAAEAVILDGTYATDVWHDNPPVTMIAPPGAVEVKSFVLYLQPGSDGGAAHLDAAVLTCTPASEDDGPYALAVWKQTSADGPLPVDFQIDMVWTPPIQSCMTTDGTAEPEYGAPLAVQTEPTGFGDSDLGLVDHANGSELDALYGKIVCNVLYLTLAGNLESNSNDLEIFLDTRPGGQNRLRGDNASLPGDPLQRMGDDGSGNGLTFDLGFEADWYLSVSGDQTPYVLHAVMAELPTGGGGPGWELGMNLGGGGGYLFGPEPVNNPYGIRVAMNNSNTAGVTVSSAVGAESVSAGVEIAIPLEAIGDPAGCIRATVFVNGAAHDYVSNQVLPSLPPGTGNLVEPRDVDFGALAGAQYVDICPPGAVGVGEGEDPAGVPAPVLLHPAVPNPFAGSTRIGFRLEHSGTVTLTLHDVRGRLVRTLMANEVHDPGMHAAAWDGTRENGTAAASGVYYARLLVGGEVHTRTLVLRRN